MASDSAEAARSCKLAEPRPSSNTEAGPAVAATLCTARQVSSDALRLRVPPASASAGQKLRARVGVFDALKNFVDRVTQGKPENTGARAAESALTCILGQMAIDHRREATWDEWGGLKSAAD